MEPPTFKDGHRRCQTGWWGVRTPTVIPHFGSEGRGHTQGMQAASGSWQGEETPPFPTPGPPEGASPADAVLSAHWDPRWTADLQNSKIIDLCCVKPPGVWQCAPGATKNRCTEQACIFMGNWAPNAFRTTCLIYNPICLVSRISVPQALTKPTIKLAYSCPQNIILSQCTSSMKKACVQKQRVEGFLSSSKCVCKEIIILWAELAFTATLSPDSQVVGLLGQPESPDIHP